MNILDHRDQWVELRLNEAAVHWTATRHYLVQAVGYAPVTAAEVHHRVIDEAHAVWQRTQTFDPGLRGQSDAQRP